MKYKIEFLPLALKGLKEIENYYLWEFGRKTATKVIQSILDSIGRLEYFPESGSLTPDKWLNEQGYRMIICKKHIAIYKKVFDTVYIYRIVDGNVEYTKLFYI